MGGDWRRRCPGFKHPDVGKEPDEDELTLHTTWVLYDNNPPERRYYCYQCKAHYPYLVDISGGHKKRYAKTAPMGPIIPDDPNNYVTENFNDD